MPRSTSRSGRRWSLNPERGRILLIEDNPYDIQLILYELERESIAQDVRVVYDGAEALAYLSHPSDGRVPACIILDLKLPKVNGLEVLEQVRGTPSLQGVPVVVFTSSGEQVDRQNCHRLGVAMYIVKPVNHEEFTKALGEIIQFYRTHVGNN